MVAAAARGGKRVGYIRVSSVDQNTDRQLEGEQLDKRFIDKCSGKDTKRPQLERALEFLREGDVLVVHSMDRLARNLVDLRMLVDDLTGRGVVIQFLKENLTFTGDDNSMAKLMLSVMGAFAEFERSLLKERQKEGIAIAKAKGTVYLGRKPALTEEESAQLRKRVNDAKKANVKVNKAELAREFGISRAALYVYLNSAYAAKRFQPA